MAEESNDQREPVPVALRFLDAFVQEQNIKWMLGLGTLILLGSSTMLVVGHWDSYTPVWKYLILLGYTAAIHASGQFVFHRLSLRKTGIALMALTVLLIPLGFLAVRWFHPEGLTLTAILSQFGMLALLAANAALAWVASNQIFGLLLRRTQPTLVASYLLLSLAGAIVPTLPTSCAPLTGLVLWFVFTAGAVKANRHVFWLTEELRLPRIFGFFPIGLLGLQYVLLFTFGVAAHLAWEWIGLGLVLTAIPILLTANTLADVFEKRHTRFDGPYPASIAIPIFIGLCLTAVGVCLSGVGYPTTFALVPTPLLAAVILAVTAARTQHPGFVWGALILATAAYQTSPVFFKELARAAVQGGAAAVHESRLPLAFYGLTYLPWLLVLTTAARLLSRRGIELFATPMRQFAATVPVLLLIAAATHPKACFPVGLALSLLILVQIYLFTRPGLVWPMLAGILLATAGLPTFVNDVVGLSGIPELSSLSWLVAAALLLWPGMRLDRWIHSQTANAADARVDASPCSMTSLGIVLTASACWLVGVLSGSTAPITGGLCLLLLFVHSWIWRQEAISTIALGYPVVAMMVFAHTSGASFTSQLTLAVGLLTFLSACGGLLTSFPVSPLTSLYARPANRVAGLGIAAALLILIPWTALAASPWLSFDTWLSVALAVMTASELAWRTSTPGLAALSWLALLSVMSLLTRVVAGDLEAAEWQPVVWATLAVGMVPLLKRVGNVQGAASPNSRRWAVRELEGCVGLTLIAVATLGLPVLSGGFRIAGVMSLIGAFRLLHGTHCPALKSMLLAVANAHLMTFVVQLCRPDLEHLGHLTPDGFQPAAVSFALAAVLSAAFWERRRLAQGFDLSLMSLLLQGGAVVSLLIRLTGAPLLTPWETLLLPVTWGLFAALHARLAVRATPPQEEGTATRVRLETATAHVWTAQAALAAGVLLLVYFRILSLGSTAGLFVPLLLAAFASGLHRLAMSDLRFRAFVSPLRQSALVLPSLTVLIAFGRHITHPVPEWLGLNSLGVLMAAGFYFWRGIESRRPEALFGSAVILNLALAMLWRELHWSDPQLFMVPLGISVLLLVELLRSRIPGHLHNPLRYAGALTILVSPTFHIVGGSWLHLITLMVASVLVVLAAMGLRVKALMYTGTAFLIADLLAIVVRGSFDHPSLLWLSGIAVGAAVIVLAAYCERHRERMLQRFRHLSARLETWS